MDFWHSSEMAFKNVDVRTVIPNPNVQNSGQDDTDASEGEKRGPHEVCVIEQAVGCLSSLDPPHCANVI